MHHSQVFQSPIFNDFLKANIDDHARLKIVPKLFLQVSVRELRNSLVSDPVYGVLKEARDAENNITISDSTLRSLFPPQLFFFSNTRSCVVVNVLYMGCYISR